MSLEVLRRDVVAGKSSQLTERLRSIRASSRELRSVTNLISKNAALSALANTHYAAENSPPPDSEESAWLKSIDAASGHYFDESSLPFSTATPDVDATHPSKPLRPSPRPSEQVQETIETAHRPSETKVADALDLTSPNVTAVGAAAQQRSPAVQDSEDDEAPPITYLQKARRESDGPVAPPAQVAPPRPEDEAEFSSETQRLLDLESSSKPAEVVHLPPMSVQRERSREIEAERHTKSEDESQSKTSRSHNHSHNELASSPSSTVGAYSATTPMPAQDSPDTSPDSDRSEENAVLPPKDMRPSVEEEREKERHDRLLAAQKEIARKAALGSVSTADEQLRYEERQASARDAEERADREDVDGPESDAKDGRETTEAEEVMNNAERSGEEQRHSHVGVGTTGDLKHATQNSESRRDTIASDDSENITVTPRNKLPLSINTGLAQHSRSNDPGQLDRTQTEQVITRASNGALPKRDASAIHDQTPSRGARLSRDVSSSPAPRHARDGLPFSSNNTQFQLPRRPAYLRISANSQSALKELNVLKGAADDPDRDYLEPLFRIQAHDSPNIHTTSLPDLIRSSTKTLSTEDHFSTMHERLDYRILRRIYHLQNANKWSLRQMLPCKEPEQPTSHHDHMMAEMQWMRKDFKSERKMKRSVCAWLAQCCADWVAATARDRLMMQINSQPPQQTPAELGDEPLPELDTSGDSPVDDLGPPTPPNELVVPSNLVIPPELSETVSALRRDGKLAQALASVPVADLADLAASIHTLPPLTPVSKFVGGKVLPKPQLPHRKRCRYEFGDEDEATDEFVDSKRARLEGDQPSEDQDSALFHPENKHIRDRLHANNAFRPPSEFVMPSTQFYEFRNGSQWLSDDDDKLKKLAKDYAFNWSLIADELQLTGIFKNASERRTPWECFERWVELEQLPAEMKKTIYFKTWFQRLEQSQQAAERRYQAQITALQAASNGQATHVPLRRRSVPHHVEKRKNSRYIWLVDAMRKLARKKEQQAYKQAEAHRAAAQRKASSETNTARPPMLTPQEFSKKRYEGDLRAAEKQRQDRQRMIEAQQRHIQAVRQAAQVQQQQGLSNGAAGQQRLGSSTTANAQQAPMQPNGQQQTQTSSQVSQQARQSMQMAQRAGHLAVPQMNAQGIPSAQMRANGQMSNAQEMARMAHVNTQARSSQYTGQQQQYQMPSANMMSPGGTGLPAQQLGQSRQPMLASMQMNSVAQQNNQQMSASPSMPPPPAPQGNPQSLSSGHVPALMNIRNQVRARFPEHSEDQINALATELLKNHSQQTTTQARQSAMNAAAGINGGMAQHSNMQAYGHNQGAYQTNQMTNGNNFMGGDASGQQPGMTPTSPQEYAAMLRQRQMAQMRMQHSPNTPHATLNGSPGIANASPSMTPVSPNMQYSNMNQMASMNMGGMNAQQRPPSRSNTPQMRVGSSGNIAGGVPSPQGVSGMQGSPRNMQASMAR